MEQNLSLQRLMRRFRERWSTLPDTRKTNNKMIAQFTFDGDGKRVKSVMDGETILFVGSHFEMQGRQVTKY